MVLDCKKKQVYGAGYFLREPLFKSLSLSVLYTLSMCTSALLNRMRPTKQQECEEHNLHMHYYCLVTRPCHNGWVQVGQGPRRISLESSPCITHRLWTIKQAPVIFLAKFQLQSVHFIMHCYLSLELPKSFSRTLLYLFCNLMSSGSPSDVQCLCGLW